MFLFLYFPLKKNVFNHQLFKTKKYSQNKNSLLQIYWILMIIIRNLSGDKIDNTNSLFCTVILYTIWDGICQQWPILDK